MDEVNEAALERVHRDHDPHDIYTEAHAALVLSIVKAGAEAVIDDNRSTTECIWCRWSWISGSDSPVRDTVVHSACCAPTRQHCAVNLRARADPVLFKVPNSTTSDFGRKQGFVAIFSRCPLRDHDHILSGVQWIQVTVDAV